MTLDQKIADLSSALQHAGIQQARFGFWAWLRDHDIWASMMGVP